MRCNWFSLVLLFVCTLLVSGCATVGGICLDDGYCSVDEKVRGNCFDCVPDFSVVEDTFSARFVVDPLTGDGQLIVSGLLESIGEYKGELPVGWALKSGQDQVIINTATQSVYFDIDDIQSFFTLNADKGSILTNGQLLINNDGVSTFSYVEYVFEGVKPDLSYKIELKINPTERIVEKDYANNYGELEFIFENDANLEAEPFPENNELELKINEARIVNISGEPTILEIVGGDEIPEFALLSVNSLRESIYTFELEEVNDVVVYPIHISVDESVPAVNASIIILRKDSIEYLDDIDFAYDEVSQPVYFNGYTYYFSVFDASPLEYVEVLVNRTQNQPGGLSSEVEYVNITTDGSDRIALGTLGYYNFEADNFNDNILSEFPVMYSSEFALNFTLDSDGKEEMYFLDKASASIISLSNIYQDNGENFVRIETVAFDGEYVRAQYEYEDGGEIEVAPGIEYDINIADDRSYVEFIKQ